MEKKKNAYFISGMAASCHCFDKVELPEDYARNYIEWLLPKEDEPLFQYAVRMAAKIDTRQPFVLIGYSFGGIIIQEMNRFLHPEKNILIASIKDEEQIPNYFRLIKKVRLTKWFPMQMVSMHKPFEYIFSRWIYSGIYRQNSSLLVQMNPTYMKWAIEHITTWIPAETVPGLYQIHGTQDKTFPYDRIVSDYRETEKKKLFPIAGTGHLLVLEKPASVSRALTEILNAPEENKDMGKESPIAY